MLNRISHLLLWFVFAATLLLVMVNAVYMLLSPKAWFALPKWLGLHGVVTPERYGDRGGAIMIRMLGALTIAALFWIAWRELGAALNE